MGQCQSLDNDGNIVVSISKDSTSGSAPRPERAGRRDKLHIRVDGKASTGSLESIFSPSDQTRRTEPESPFSRTSTPHGYALNEGASSTKAAPKKVIEFFTEYQDFDEERQMTDFNSSPASRLHINMSGAVIESVIAEEESLGAPSDEEEFIQQQRQAQQQEAGGPTKENDENQRTPIASARSRATPKSSDSQSRVKLLNKRITTPESIIHRAPLLAPPKGAAQDKLVAKTISSVNPHILASFNKIKIQVELAKRAEKHRRHKEKLKDRVEDVQGYRDLWKEYKQIELKVTQNDTDDSNQEATQSQSKGMDLNTPNTWYFDFQCLNKGKREEEHKKETNLSLLSASSMEVQRRLYAEKRRERKKRAVGRQRERHNSWELSVTDKSFSSRKSSSSHMSHGVSGKAEKSDYGPPRQIGSLASPRNMEVSYVSSIGSTPRATSRIGLVESDDCSEPGSLVSDIDCTNDYNVPRRRRRKRSSFETSHDDSSFSTFDDRSFDSHGSRGGLDLTSFMQMCHDGENAPSSIEVKNTFESKQNPKGWNGVDPTAPESSLIEGLTLPSVEIDALANGQVKWRQFPNEKNPTTADGFPRCLENEYANHDPAKLNNISAISPMTKILNNSAKVTAYDIQGGSLSMGQPSNVSHVATIAKDTVCDSALGKESPRLLRSSMQENDNEKPTSRSYLEDVKEISSPKSLIAHELSSKDSGECVDNTSIESNNKREVFGQGFGVYNPSIALMSTKDFLLISSAEKTFLESNREASVKEILHGTTLRSTKPLSRKAEAQRQAYSSVISNMSTEDFLLISALSEKSQMTKLEDAASDAQHEGDMKYNGEQD